jgi:DNA end-binding protein Ku
VIGLHTILKGSISFGLVNIPVRMYAATDEKRVAFRHLHRPCKTPIQYTRTCPTCDREVPWEEVVKGYEYADGRYVLMEKEELESILPENRRSIEILDFVDLKEIDPIYFDRTYYLGPGDTGEKAYALLREAIESTGKIGVAQLTIRSKQSLAVVRSYRNVLVMEIIFYPDEVRDADQIPGLPRETELPEKELEMARQLIGNLSTSFDPGKYKDQYRESLEEMIEKKIHGEEIVEAPETRPEKVVDLMEALKASLEATQPKGKGRRKKTSG